jgi:amino acid transporter
MPLADSGGGAAGVGGGLLSARPDAALGAPPAVVLSLPAAAPRTGGALSSPSRYARLDGSDGASSGDDGKSGGGATAGGAHPAGAAAADTRKLGALAVAIISFGSVAGGPYGIEAAVGAAGALPTLLGCVALAFLWSAPQALVTAELATMFPSNGGYITWVVRGLGPVLGFVNAANAVASAACNLPLYPVLFVSYISALYPDIPDAGLFGIKAAGLVLTVALNVAGIEAVELASLLFTVIVQTPFVLIPIAAAVTGRPGFHWATGPTSVLPGWQSSFAVFVSTLCWNAQGWVNVGNIASDVRNPQVSYPLGSALAVALVAINYIYPVAVCAALAPDASAWNTGYFANIGSSVAPWLGAYTTAVSVFSSANNFLPQMGTTARALRYAALYRMVPLPYLHTKWARSGAPVAAILLQGALCAVLMNFSFDTLVIVNVLFYNVGLALQFGAFLALKHRAPGLARPFVVPGGLAGAWAISLAFFGVLALGFYAAAVSDGWVMVILLGCNAGFVLGGLAWARWGYDDGLLDRVEAADAPPPPAPAGGSGSSGGDATPAGDAGAAEEGGATPAAGGEGAPLVAGGSSSGSAGVVDITALHVDITAAGGHASRVDGGRGGAGAVAAEPGEFTPGGGDAGIALVRILAGPGFVAARRSAAAGAASVASSVGGTPIASPPSSAGSVAAGGGGGGGGGAAASLASSVDSIARTVSQRMLGLAGGGSSGGGGASASAAAGGKDARHALLAQDFLSPPSSSAAGAAAAVPAGSPAAFSFATHAPPLSGRYTRRAANGSSSSSADGDVSPSDEAAAGQSSRWRSSSADGNGSSSLDGRRTPHWGDAASSSAAAAACVADGNGRGWGE